MRSYDKMNKENYVLCPKCKKKLFRITTNSKYEHIFMWCKSCKEEIEFNKKEPKSHC